MQKFCLQLLAVFLFVFKTIINTILIVPSNHSFCTYSSQGSSIFRFIDEDGIRFQLTSRGVFHSNIGSLEAVGYVCVLSDSPENLDVQSNC